MMKETKADPNALLRNNLLKLKQKVIDTNKLLDLYHTLKGDLEIAHTRIRNQALDAANLRVQVDQLIKEREPLLKTIQERELECSTLQKEKERIKISFQSQKVSKKMKQQYIKLIYFLFPLY